MLTLPWDNPILNGFYVFEGIDGAGTTTQAKRLAEHFSVDYATVFTFEPTDLPIGAVIREYLNGSEGADARTLSLLYAADRNEHLERPHEGIRARIERGERVVCDRYLFSSLAYQGTFDDFAFVERINADFPLPEHLFFIDTSVDEADRRLASRASRDRYENRPLQERVHATYRRVIAEFERRTEVRIHRIDGSRDPNSVFEAITSCIG